MEQSTETVHAYAWHLRHAMRIAQLLPENREEAQAILIVLRELLEWQGARRQASQIVGEFPPRSNDAAAVFEVLQRFVDELWQEPPPADRSIRARAEQCAALVRFPPRR